MRDNNTELFHNVLFFRRTSFLMKQHLLVDLGKILYYGKKNLHMAFWLVCCLKKIT